MAIQSWKKHCNPPQHHNSGPSQQMWKWGSGHTLPWPHHWQIQREKAEERSKAPLCSRMIEPHLRGIQDAGAHRSQVRVYLYALVTGSLHFQQQQGRYCWHLSTPQFPTDKKIQEPHRPTNHCACPTTPPRKLHSDRLSYSKLAGILEADISLKCLSWVSETELNLFTGSYIRTQVPLLYFYLINMKSYNFFNSP